jgi:predicted transcriptional regulator
VTTEEYLYFETDQSCALCGQQGIDNLTIHHIDRNRSNNEYDNQIVLCHNCHCRFHQNKGISHSDIENRKRLLIEKTITQYGINALKIAYRNNIGVLAMPFLLYHLVDFGFMTKEEDIIGYEEQEDAVSRFSLTPKGKSLYEKWIK